MFILPISLSVIYLSFVYNPVQFLIFLSTRTFRYIYDIPTATWLIYFSVDEHIVVHLFHLYCFVYKIYYVYMHVLIFKAPPLVLIKRYVVCISFLLL